MKIIPEYSWLGPRTATIDHSLEKNNIHNQRGPNWSLLRSWVVKNTMSKNLDLLGLFDAWKKVKTILFPDAGEFDGDDYHMVESANKKVTNKP